MQCFLIGHSSGELLECLFYVHPSRRAFLIQRTCDLYEELWPGVKLLEPEGRLAISAASVLYSGILDEIEKNDYDVFSKRASLSLWEKLKRVPALWLKVRSL